MKSISLTVIALILLSTVCLSAQEYKVSKNTGRLEIMEVNHVSVEGHNGNEIIFTSTSHKHDQDERAKGLRALSSLGLEDNTGLGLSVVTKGDVVEVQQLKKTEGPEIKILVPRGVVVSYYHTSPYGEDINISDFDGTIEVSTVHNGVRLTNTTGPITVNTVHGDIDASLGNALKAAVKLESAHGHVDVALPVTTKATLTLDTKWGEVLVDPDFKIELERTGEMVTYSGKLRGKLNGGGNEIELASHHDNVYLRKK